MIHKQKVTIEVNGKRIVATVTVDMSGITMDDHLSAKMILAAVASGQQSVSYVSRHNPTKVARCIMSESAPVTEVTDPRFRLVA